MEGGHYLLPFFFFGAGFFAAFVALFFAGFFAALVAFALAGFAALVAFAPSLRLGAGLAGLADFAAFAAPSPPLAAGLACRF
jgi:hypothetical protein